MEMEHSKLVQTAVQRPIWRFSDANLNCHCRGSAVVAEILALIYEQTGFGPMEEGISVNQNHILEMFELKSWSCCVVPVEYSKMDLHSFRTSLAEVRG